MTLGTASLITGATAIVLATPAAATAAWSEYRTPVAGTWVVQDMFDRTAGGSAQIAKGGKRLARLSVKVGERNKGEGGCGDARTVAIAKSLPIKRVGSYQRPVVGRLGKDKLITTISTTLTVDGQRRPGKIEVIFEKDGRSAFTVRMETGNCGLDFALRKKK